MKKRYQNPTTIKIQVETSILCASGSMLMTPKGIISPLQKKTMEW